MKWIKLDGSLRPQISPEGNFALNGGTSGCAASTSPVGVLWQRRPKNRILCTQREPAWVGLSVRFFLIFFFRGLRTHCARCRLLTHAERVGSGWGTDFEGVVSGPPPQLCNWRPGSWTGAGVRVGTSLPWVDSRCTVFVLAIGADFVSNFPRFWRPKCLNGRVNFGQSVSGLNEAITRSGMKVRKHSWSSWAVKSGAPEGGLELPREIRNFSKIFAGKKKSARNLHVGRFECIGGIGGDRSARIFVSRQFRPVRRQQHVHRDDGGALRLPTAESGTSDRHALSMGSSSSEAPRGGGGEMIRH